MVTKQRLGVKSTRGEKHTPWWLSDAWLINPGGEPQSRRK